jgi:phosphoesterase RecJ-like protein
LQQFIKTWDLIKSSRYVLIITHINPDPDTIGSALALSNLFEEERIKHKVFNVSSNIPKNLDFLNRFDKIINELPKFYDLVISVDCGDMKRFGTKVDSSVELINIDHHFSNDRYGTINIVDDTKPSTGEIIYDLFKANELYISKSSAQCLYTAIYDDTIRFSTDRCNERTFKTAADLIECGVECHYMSKMLYRRDSLAKYRVLPMVLETLELFCEGEVGTVYATSEMLKKSGADIVECEDALDLILNINIIKIAIFLRVVGEKVRVSFRSKGKYNVNTIASKFNGGGHKLAAGCSIDTLDIGRAKDEIIKVIESDIHEEKK